MKEIQKGRRKRWKCRNMLVESGAKNANSRGRGALLTRNLTKARAKPNKQLAAAFLPIWIPNSSKRRTMVVGSASPSNTLAIPSGRRGIMNVSGDSRQRGMLCDKQCGPLCDSVHWPTASCLIASFSLTLLLSLLFSFAHLCRQHPVTRYHPKFISNSRRFLHSHVDWSPVVL